MSLVVFFLAYLILSFNLLYKNLWRQDCSKSVDLRHYYLIKNWTFFVFIISTFLFLRILYSVYSEKISNQLLQAHNFSFVTIIPWLFVYGKILINPEILYGYPKLEKRLIEIQKITTVNNSIWIYDLANISKLDNKKHSCNIKNVLPYIADIENIVQEKHPFRNTKFSYQNFVELLNIPSSHVHYIFKYHSIVSFKQYKDYCRIEDALKLIDQGSLDASMLENLSGKVGFISYDSFFTTFKSHTKLTPKEYLNCQNNLKFTEC
ncbi:helix-turn-helix domain-containing protein [Changchengzhania lutea]|uniref:helix-turn-helix domain-containing protein n=1 Tax=Changchengzhania lutea TaxID=2049305 RepID=UPI001C8F98DF|nr:helix-turn-helix domain-containing protein [Changchengzhania lutea]